ncbi:MAG: hypothetical protein KDB50_05330, partial [Mycobacterium sp.]|nr:hypothetical protein [Mycobacterium sp.]
RESIARSAVDTGPGTTSARAVSPEGEIVAVRDNGVARDLLLIGTDRSVRELYTLPDPDVSVFGYVGIDQRWIVMAIDRLPRNANGVLPAVSRIEVIDRRTGERRMVDERSVADRATIPERNVLDSVVLFDGKVYWISRDTYNGDTGAAHMFDPATGTRTTIASGPIHDIQTGPDGAAWSNTPAALPAPVAAVPAVDMTSIGTDGVAYGWVRTATEGETGIGYWSPQSGEIRIAGLDIDTADFRRPVLVFDSFVILDPGGSATTLETSAVVIDTRSGAVVTLGPRSPGEYDQMVASQGGTLAMSLADGPGRGVKQTNYRAGMLRSDDLSPATC